MSQLDADQYLRLTPATTYGQSDGLYFDKTNSLLVLVIADAVVWSVDANGAMLAGALEAADLNIASQARGDLLRRGASAWERVVAKTSGTFIGGDGTDVVMQTMGGDATLDGAGALTVTDVTLGSDAAGDIHYKSSATVTARLAKGSVGQVLRMNAAGTLPAWRTEVNKEWSEDFNALATSAIIPCTRFDGVAYTGATNILHYLTTPGGRVLGAYPLGAGQTLLPNVVVANGLNIGGDQTDNEGFELFSHFMMASGKPFVAGTDAAFYFTCKFEITDADGLDTLVVGFRQAEAVQNPYTGYTEYVGLGLNTAADPMAVKIITEKAGGGTTVTDTMQTLAQSTAVQFKVLVSAAGVVTYQHDIAVPGTLAAPTATAAITLTSTCPVIPFFHFLHDTAIADQVIIHKWDAGYQ